MRLEIFNRENAIDIYLKRIVKNDVPEDLQSELRVYAVVQICGYIERSMEVIILDRLQARGHPRLLEFVKSHFKIGINFKCPAIKSLLERFDLKWARSFQDFLDDHDEVVEAIGSAYTLRNQAAHGNAPSVGIVRVRELFDNAKIVIQAVIDATN
ncbi:HEPN domain-containing protein [Novosphingobium sp. AAP93]|uniref:HEPN domain-containing protein n=1 Tax=Novosphingobium sp. AAP93 TaxID=1523427 RepID=UPI0012E1D1E3|nr:HEPN domain-containing protein [Novosphingobium sp. AAP93]